MRFGTRFWGIGKALLLIGALGATFVLFFFVSMRIALRAGQVQVPDFVGQTVSDATRTAAGLELRLGVSDIPRSSEKVPSGRIVQQDPPAGVEARPQRTIRVWVSSGPHVTQVPALVGQTERTVNMKVEQDGLATTVSEIASADYPPDVIVAQDPPASARAPKVALLINRREQEAAYVMPDVIGMDGGRVEAVLRGRGFRVTITGTQPYAGIPAGTVVRQQPAAGFRVGPADPIAIEVSR